MNNYFNKNISMFQNSAALRKAFDALFLMDEGLVPAGSLKDEERAKIYALSLRLFEKCVFVSANCLVRKQHVECNYGSVLIFICH